MLEVLVRMALGDQPSGHLATDSEPAIVMTGICNRSP
jgi:hypothetical protein